jgi:pyrroline-5-carboxylate reductase
MLARMARIAIIGGGSIGEALLSGMLRAGRQVKDLVVAEKDPGRAKYLSETYSVLVTTVADAVDTATYVIVAVKPFDVEGLVAEIADAAARAETDTAEKVFVTVAAGVTAAFYENKLPAGSPVIRVMPNAPVVVGGGVSALAAGRFATAEHLKEVSAIFDAVGGVLTVPESQLDAVTAVSGSGPAYVFLLAEAMTKAGIAAGLPAALAARLARETVAGSGELLHRSELDAATLRQNVTSPGGTTAAALEVLMGPDGFDALLTKAIAAATRRGRELA